MADLEKLEQVKILCDPALGIKIEDIVYLWIVGSHSSKRKKVQIEPDKFTVENKELKKIQREENRYLLARIPVNEAGELDNSSPQRAWLKQFALMFFTSDNRSNFT